MISEKDSWLKEAPNCVRQGGVIQLVQAFETNFAKQKKDPNFKFRVNFRSRKIVKTEVIDFDKRYATIKRTSDKTAELWIFKDKLGGPLKIVDSKKYIDVLSEMDKPPSDFKIQYYYRTGEFYLLLPTKMTHQSRRSKHDVVALDPGSRLFLTAYSPTGGVGTFPQHGLEKTKERLLKIDHISSSIAKSKNKTRKEKRSKKNRKKKQHRLWKKIQDTRHHMHYTTINFLLDNFQQILLPKFETQKMVSNERRPFGSKTAREMLSWGHYEFQQRLLWKAKSSGNRVHIVSEEKTSMTCGGCGLLDRNLGGKEVYDCKGCGWKVDRDLNAARNILIRNMGICDFPSRSSMKIEQK